MVVGFGEVVFRRSKNAPTGHYQLALGLSKQKQKNQLAVTIRRVFVPTSIGSCSSSGALSDL